MFIFIAITRTIFSVISILPDHFTVITLQEISFWCQNTGYISFSLMQNIFPLLLCFTIQLSFVYKNFLLKHTECPGFQWGEVCLTTITWPSVKKTLCFLSSGKTRNPAKAAFWTGITFVLSTKATIPDEDYKENIMMLTEAEQNSNWKVNLH